MGMPDPEHPVHRIPSCETWYVPVDGRPADISSTMSSCSPIVSPATSPSMVVPPGYAVSPDPPHSKSAQPQWASKADQDLREFGTGVKHIFRNTRRSIEKTSNKAYKATGKAVQQAQADIQHLGVSSHGGAKRTCLHCKLNMWASTEQLLLL
eukprot:351557-Chlamydomonas_euryale.AAC.24